MNTIVIYQSTSGFTRKYAGWIAEELQADLFPAKQINPARLSSYDLIIFGGSLHAVGISGVGMIKKNLHRLTGKKVIVFAVGASPPRDGVFEEVRSRNFTEEERQRIRFFYLRGGFDFSKLDLPNKILMTLLRWKLQRKRTLTADEKGMLAAYDRPMDFTDRESIRELVAWGRGGA